MREIKYDIWRFNECEKDHLISMVAENSYAYSETKSMFQECKTIDDVVKKINELYETVKILYSEIRRGIMRKENKQKTEYIDLGKIKTFTIMT